MKPVVIIGGRKAIHDPNKNKITVQFFFPNPHETGEIDFISGDVPRMIIKAGPRVEVDVDRLEIERKEDRKRIKK